MIPNDSNQKRLSDQSIGQAGPNKKARKDTWIQSSFITDSPSSRPASSSKVSKLHTAGYKAPVLPHANLRFGDAVKGEKSEWKPRSNPIYQLSRPTPPPDRSNEASTSKVEAKPLASWMNPSHILSKSSRESADPHTPRRPLSAFLTSATSTPFLAAIKSENTTPEGKGKVAMITPLTTRLAQVTAPHSIPRKREESVTRSLAVKDEEEESKANIEELDLFKGLGLSPEKNSRNGRGQNGFVRNGLAERATKSITRSHKSLSLWQHEASLLFPDPKRLKALGAKPSNISPPTLRLRILRILGRSETPATSYNPSPDGYILARCLCLSRQDGKEPGSEETIMFSFSKASSQGDGASATRVCSPLGIRKGNEVKTWKPWSEVELGVPDGIEEDDTNMSGAGHVKMKKEVVIVCTRFITGALPDIKPLPAEADTSVDHAMDELPDPS